MLGMEMPVSGVWAEAEIAKAQRRRGRMRRVMLVIVWGAPVLGALGRQPSSLVAVDPDHYRSGGGEGVFEAGALRGEHLAAVFGDVPIVFEADAELAGDVDAGFVGETHARGERGGVAADEVGPLVAVHADAVADAVSEVFVVGAVAGGGDDVARGGVDSLALDAGTSGGEGGGLGLMDDVEDLALLVEFG